MVDIIDSQEIQKYWWDLIFSRRPYSRLQILRFDLLRKASLIFMMEEGAFKIFGTLGFKTWLSLILEWMEFLFFPTVRHRTSSLKLAPLFIFSYKGTCLPARTNVPWIIFKYLRLSSEVLPVMSVLTHSLVVLLIIRAPFSLEVIQIEVRIFVHLMNKTSLDLPRRMSEWAELSIFTSIKVLGVSGTETGLVFLYMVESFHSIVRIFAFLFFRALFCLL